MVNEQPTTRRERRIAARKAQILDAAAAVFAEKGFHRATTKEIAEAADVSEGTIYNYFDSKADLLIGIMTRLAELEHLDEELADALQSDARDFLVAIFRHRMGLIQQNDEMVQAIMPEMLVNPALRERFYQQFIRPITTLFEQYIRARIELGHMRSVNVPLTVRAMQSMFVGLLILRILGDEPLQSGWDELPEVLATLIFDGLSPRDGG
ncbi:MAG: TetR/AcrR family transcriptional regulator [Anaerolineales bacterium]|nr:MAG: TetR/AcrR family transcriptional regulator [Anaerolineales bacterium]